MAKEKISISSTCHLIRSQVTGGDVSVIYIYQQADFHYHHEGKSFSFLKANKVPMAIDRSRRRLQPSFDCYFASPRN